MASPVLFICRQGNGSGQQRPIFTVHCPAQQSGLLAAKFGPGHMVLCCASGIKYAAAQLSRFMQCITPNIPYFEYCFGTEKAQVFNLLTASISYEPKQEDEMKTKKFIKLMSLVAIVVCTLHGCKDKVEAIKPVQGQMTESVYASVTVVPEDSYHVFASVQGIIDALLVEEGDTVFNGQVIAKITSQLPEINRENAALRLELARENFKGKSTILGSIAAEIETARKQLQIDSLNYSRQQRLWEQNIGSQSEFENRKLKYDLSRANLDLLKKKYRQTDVELENNFEQSKNILKQAETNLQDYIIQSRLDGRVYTLVKNEGELINAQESLGQIGRINAFIIELEVDEVDVVRISEGLPALIALDAYPGKAFEAVITRIYPTKDERTQTFKLEARFTLPPPVLYAGLAGEANIVLAKKDMALSIPVEYLMEGSKVMTENGEVKVDVGMRNLERVEITAGIDTSTSILKP
jgi:RND family efflux transporter MFP subunit